MPVISFLRRLRDDVGGFSMVSVMGLLMVGGLLVAAGFAASNGDIGIAKGDQARKEAYQAAEAGLNVYAFHLNQDNAYWTHCTNVPAPNGTESSAINQPWNGTLPDPRNWRTVTGTNDQYAIELIPANGYTQCDEANPGSSMLDNATGTFRIRSTGRARTNSGAWVKRTVVGTFRRRSFIDYIYFTDFETADPVTYGSATAIQWASDNCQLWKRQGRSTSCTSIQFADTDVVAGPFHTNDDILTCGTPTFGRTATDSVEVSAPPLGYRTNCGAIVPDFQGTFVTNSPVLTLPPSNATLQSVAGVTYTGTTKIALSNGNMTVTNSAGSTSTVAIPTNGVVYVKSGTCGSGSYDIVQKYDNPIGCGDVWVHGTTTRNLTIAADNDVIIDGDVRRSGDVVIGLIANNFVRIFHPVTRDAYDNCTGNATTPSPGTLNTVTLDTAILALAHSFIVDNYYCGAKLGNLTVNGAIAQKFRGPVGTSGGSGGTGYVKAYTYDDRLRYREPPSFLDPVQVSWRIARQTELVPPR
jgi:Tfp pilus assembly protein PilX